MQTAQTALHWGLEGRLMQPKSSFGSAGRKAKGRRIGALAALGCLVGAIGYAGFALLTR